MYLSEYDLRLAEARYADTLRQARALGLLRQAQKHAMVADPAARKVSLLARLSALLFSRRAARSLP